jgi:glucokinase
MDSRRKRVLLADIGATNARLALLTNGILGQIKNFRVADAPGLEDVIRSFLEKDCGSVSVQEAVLAVAGPVDQTSCVLTNCSWSIDCDELCNAFGFANTRLCNDFEAVGWSLPHLTKADLCPIGGGEGVSGAAMAVLGPGTGLGVACLKPGAREHVIITSEGGHATMAGSSPYEDAIIDYLRRQFGHVSAERVVSGLGLENLYRAVMAVEGMDGPARTAPEITRAGLTGLCPVSQRALELFCAMLGTMAGNVALMFAAKGGVYIAGGIVPRMTDFLTKSEFRARFEAKGRFKSYLESVPTSVIIHPAASFLGLQGLAS